MLSYISLTTQIVLYKDGEYVGKHEAYVDRYIDNMEEAQRIKSRGDYIYIYDSNDDLYQNVDGCMAACIINILIIGVSMFFYIPYCRLREPRRDEFARKLVVVGLSLHTLTFVVTFVTFLSTNVDLNTADGTFYIENYDGVSKQMRAISPFVFNMLIYTYFLWVYTKHYESAKGMSDNVRISQNNN